MSWLNSPDPIPGVATSCDPIDTIIVPRTSDLGGFSVRRALPSARRRMVGPFIFFDQMGPAELLVGGGIDVRPHPHIGLATVTYLFEGEMYHRDSLGTEIAIAPGALNWMSAGKGIVHSERERPVRLQEKRPLFGLQSWVALPKQLEEGDPSFQHHGAEEQPEFADNGASVKLIAGNLYGHEAPVQTASDMFYADISLEPGAKVPLDAGWEERGLYTISGQITIAGQPFDPAQLLVFKPGDHLVIENKTSSPARFVVLGGEPMDGKRYIWWNFVSSSKERIEQAKEDWKLGRFDTVPGDAEEFIPLPDRPGP
ncbi:redox-sensitive bicupin YhaK (pirin superfamily) [Labrenzia sp. EL_13]|uniref:pirin family protein n=1 Tax=Roseibium album TaxID=311410 RepID=UPI000CF182A3|nr:pirin family protein [Roseibium album]MBG6146718.1 redox-sensitive bicupin YhaK (pirin superfamily) [Labrenzia sp. EL_142]MBG6200749.1 redox-sensitive bicupin YhaK (pirin superfamily) [Labrenzia sp. EL_13]MCR9060736.1 pirin family protein [Paracoccaceae bacterium]